MLNQYSIRISKLLDVVLGYESLKEYEHNTDTGATVGRNANRLEGASVTCGGKTFHMIPNEGVNNLHSGSEGYHVRLWETLDQEACNTLAASLRLGYTNTIAVILGDISNPHFAVKMKEIEGHAWQATNALLLAGHRDILLLHGATYISSARERLEGYCRAFRERGLTVDQALVREVPVVSHGCESVLEELDREGRTYTAVFAFSDMLAWEAWCGLTKRGRDVPGDCSIIGFDHIESRLGLPLGLTSISSYKGRMSVKAVDILVDQIKGSGERQQVVIDTALAPGNTIRERNVE